MESCPEVGVIGGNYSIRFGITTLGMTKVMGCAKCGKEENITNFDDW
jgi:hypothetical protein